MARRVRPESVAALYRQVLRCHRDKLPPPMRGMGDAYARDEFRRHRDEKTTSRQWQVFMMEWRNYMQLLSGKGQSEQRSGDIPEDLIIGMNAEQRQRLQILREEARAAFAAEPEAGVR